MARARPGWASAGPQKDPRKGSIFLLMLVCCSALEASVDSLGIFLLMLVVAPVALKL